MNIVDKIAADWKGAQSSSEEDLWGWQWGGSTSIDQARDFLSPRVSGRVLEVGCGGGKYTKLLCEMADEVISSDVHEVALEEASAYAPEAEYVLIDGEGLRPGFKYDYFDVVVILDVLQHLPQSLTLKYLIDARKVGFSIVFDLPDVTLSHGREHFHRAACNKVWRKLFDLGYMTYYSEDMIEVMMDIAGWVPEKIGEMGCLGPRDSVYYGVRGEQK